MNYVLAVLTHGDDAASACAAIESFGEHVTPAPSFQWVYRDGPGLSLAALPTLCDFAGVHSAGRPQGFCGATRNLWRLAAGIPLDHDHGYVPGPTDHDHVFWLEHDFRFTRPVDLRALAAVLDTQPQLAQMALMRNAANKAERAAGGLYESRPDTYERRAGRARWPGTSYTVEWLEHRAYFTTTPSLMRRDFMAERPWPDYPAECEGRFGLDLVAAGYSFGVWGDGSPWVEHVGQRTGFGY